MKKEALLILLIICLISGCGKTERIDTKEVKEAIKSREIKKISTVEIIERALNQGKKDINSLVICLNNSKDHLIKEHQKCLNNRDSALVAEVKLVGSKAFIPLNKVEKELFDAYGYNFSQRQKLYSNIQDLKNGQMLFTAPIYKVEHSFTSKEPDSLQNFYVLYIYYNKKNIVLSIE